MFKSLNIILQHIYFMLIGSLIVISVGYAADPDPIWPQFHGPNRDNLSTESGLLKKWPENGPALLWTARGLGHGYSTVSIAAGMIYTAGSIEKDTVITALNVDSKILWQVKNGPAWTRDRPGTRGTPTIDEDRLYHQSPIGNLVCLDAGTGNEKLKPRKHLYGQSFALYAISEYFLATGRQDVLDFAIRFFGLLEEKSHDKMYGGYIEFFNEDWTPVPAGESSYMGAPADLKLMNTHLHLTEAMTTFYRACKLPLASGCWN